MNYEIFFPRGIATGNAFCNRKEERMRLTQNILSSQHSLLTSPRRYGKTSLVFYVAEEMGIPFGEADLFVAVDAKKIEQAIITGIKKIIANIGTPIEQVLEILRTYFKDRNTQWTVGTQGINLALIPSFNSDPATNILEALQALENLLQKKKKRAVLFIDEIQEIGEIAEGKGIEGAIRHVAQKTTYLSMVFSGSNRHLLTKMFYDKSRPLYKLCDRIVIDRISESEYISHINEIALKKWKKKLSNDVLTAIFELTELHPYYLNNLCLHLWESSDNTTPQSVDVLNCWHKMIKDERSETLNELLSLSIGQRKILNIIANGQKTNLTSKKTLNVVDLSGSSVIEAVNVLEQKDYIEQLETNEYRVIDPLIKHTLISYYSKLQ